MIKIIKTSLKNSNKDGEFHSRNEFDYQVEVKLTFAELREQLPLEAACFAADFPGREDGNEHSLYFSINNNNELIAIYANCYANRYQNTVKYCFSTTLRRWAELARD